MAVKFWFLALGVCALSTNVPVRNLPTGTPNSSAPAKRQPASDHHFGKIACDPISLTGPVEVQVDAPKIQSEKRFPLLSMACR